ncbi:unnamed protein product [Psylliodes chrysocephalus]|uniref:Uncharacterized protein n=1 Tax=Psylliodes chrysocephalus TaxID=3402493 RepID=A0A9P0D6Q1_9CUCU|nr:unnamed protein product [Psylliodes chrysocephala]
MTLRILLNFDDVIRNFVERRPEKDFNDSSERSKLRKTEDLRHLTPEELTFAASMSHRDAGQLSEEAAKTRNKHFRMYRIRFFRKFNRQVCNRDILNRLLLTSDPFISRSKQKHMKKKEPYSSETLQLLMPESHKGGRSEILQDESEEKDTVEDSEKEN